MLKQSIDLPGIGNARELGGYSTGYGRIKPGLLLRTGAMNNMMPDTVNKLMNEYRLQYVIDFRMTGEQSAVPDPDIPGARNIHLSVIEIEDYPIDDSELIEVYHKCSDRMQLFEMSYQAGILIIIKRAVAQDVFHRRMLCAALVYTRLAESISGIRSTV